jgi:redox-sensing transcriptional repressor
VSPRAISEKTIGRLSLYRRILNDLLAQSIANIYSHQLATMAGGTAAQVRRDFMTIGFSGSPTRGYDIAELIKTIGQFLDAPKNLNVALIGVGNIGRALLAYFPSHRPNLSIVAAFDRDPGKVNRVIQGCHCYPIERLSEIFETRTIRVGIIAVPAPEAQGIADMMVRAGVRGIVNFARVPLRVPADVYVENIDMTMSLEKVAFFARQRTKEKEEEQ